MPAGRTTRQRLVSNENDENTTAATTRTTRAKSAALGGVDEPAPSKTALQPRKAAVNANPQAGQRRRAALGDVSNVAKVEAPEGKKAAAVTGRVGLVSKAAQPSGVQKNASRPATSRPVLATKEVKKPEVKRTGSGSGAIGVQKRKATASAATSVAGDDASENANSENEPMRKKVHAAEPEKLKIPQVVDVVQVTVEKLPAVVTAAAAAPIPEPNLAQKFEDAAAEVAEPELPPGVQELELDDVDDPFMVTEYVQEIFDYLKDLECKSMPNPTYMDDQDDLEWKMRGILVDWLIEVHTRFHLLPETLFLSINIIDRFLSAKVVRLDRLQLVGVAAMFIASKYEEVLSPHISNFQKVTDDGFTDAEILDAEVFILKTLNYDLSYPSPMNFLRRVSKADNFDFWSRSLGKFLMEISLLDHRLMAYRPSHIAAAAMYLSRLIFDRGEWDDILCWYSGYTEEEVEPVVHLMVDYLARPIIHEAFYKKYANKKFLKASLISRRWAKMNAIHFGITDTNISLDQLYS